LTHFRRKKSTHFDLTFRLNQTQKTALQQLAKNLKESTRFRGILNAYFVSMTSNGEKTTTQVENPSAGCPSFELPRQGRNGSRQTCPEHQPRPEIEVLGWDARSYRLALRQHKS